MAAPGSIDYYNQAIQQQQQQQQQQNYYSMQPVQQQQYQVQQQNVVVAQHETKYDIKNAGYEVAEVYTDVDEYNYFTQHVFHSQAVRINNLTLKNLPKSNFIHRLFYQALYIDLNRKSWRVLIFYIFMYMCPYIGVFIGQTSVLTIIIPVFVFLLVLYMLLFRIWVKINVDKNDKIIQFHKCLSKPTCINDQDLLDYLNILPQFGGPLRNQFISFSKKNFVTLVTSNNTRVQANNQNVSVNMNFQNITAQVFQGKDDFTEVKMMVYGRRWKERMFFSYDSVKSFFNFTNLHFLFVFLIVTWNFAACCYYYSHPSVQPNFTPMFWMSGYNYL